MTEKDKVFAREIFNQIIEQYDLEQSSENAEKVMEQNRSSVAHCTSKSSEIDYYNFNLDKVKQAMNLS